MGETKGEWACGVAIRDGMSRRMGYSRKREKGCGVVGFARKGGRTEVRGGGFRWTSQSFRGRFLFDFFFSFSFFLM